MDRVIVIEEDPEENHEPTIEEVRDYAEFLGIDCDKEPHLMWIAKEGVRAKVPEPWKACIENGSEDVFYFNFETRESVWEHPCDEKYRQMLDEYRAKGSATRSLEACPGKADNESEDEVMTDEELQMEEQRVLEADPRDLEARVHSMMWDSTPNASPQGNMRMNDMTRDSPASAGSAGRCLVESLEEESFEDDDAQDSGEVARGPAFADENYSPTLHGSKRISLTSLKEEDEDMDEGNGKSSGSSTPASREADAATMEAQRKRLQLITNELSDDESLSQQSTPHGDSMSSTAGRSADGSSPTKGREQRFDAGNSKDRGFFAKTRLLKELKGIFADPPPYIHVACDEANILDWSFLLEGPEDTPYEGGWYWGRLNLSKDYPFAPPSILMVTPNGRFETNTRLCLSMSDYHPESWQPSWSLSTVLKGLLSFMCEDTLTAGSITPVPSDQARKILARASLKWNQAQPEFMEAFPEVQAIVAAAASRKSLKDGAAPAVANPDDSIPRTAQHPAAMPTHRTDRARLTSHADMHSCVTIQRHWRGKKVRKKFRAALIAIRVANRLRGKRLVGSRFDSNAIRLRHAERNVRTKERCHGPSHPEVAQALLHLADRHKECAASSGATGSASSSQRLRLDSLQRALHIMEEHHGKNSTKLTDILTSLASAHKDMGGVQAEKELLARVSSIRATQLAAAAAGRGSAGVGLAASPRVGLTVDTLTDYNVDAEDEIEDTVQSSPASANLSSAPSQSHSGGRALPPISHGKATVAARQLLGLEHSGQSGQSGKSSNLSEVSEDFPSDFEIPSPEPPGHLPLGDTLELSASGTLEDDIAIAMAAATGSSAAPDHNIAASAVAKRVEAASNGIPDKASVLLSVHKPVHIRVQDVKADLQSLSRVLCELREIRAQQSEYLQDLMRLKEEQPVGIAA